MPKSRTVYIWGGNMNLTLLSIGFFAVSIVLGLIGLLQSYIQARIIGESAEEVSKNIVQDSEHKLVEKVVDELLNK